MRSILYELALCLVFYSLFFLAPFFLPANSAWSLLPLLIGMVIIPMFRRLFLRSSPFGLITAATIAGVFYTGLYLAALDSSMHVEGASFNDREFYMVLAAFAFSVYGMIGGLGLGFTAALVHEATAFIVGLISQSTRRSNP